MALIFENSTCSICKEVLTENHDVITWQTFLSKEHKFWKYSDSGMHKSCFEKWKYKEEFEELYKYQPYIDFDDPTLKRMIKEHGMPNWLQEIKNYRAKNRI